jgi:teichuronic acid biosynthesis glycosyltransferase TuaG
LKSLKQFTSQFQLKIQGFLLSIFSQKIKISISGYISNPIVSIILPVYNAEKNLCETIKSILKQNVTNFELIIIDDSSSDNSVKIINTFAAFDSRIILKKLRVNSGGPAKPRNIGLKLAKGKYIAFCDSDDLWHPDKLKIQLNFLQAKNKFMIASELSIINEKDTYKFYLAKIDRVNNKKLSLIKIQIIKLKNLFYENLIANSSVLVLAEKIKPFSFNENTKFVAIEDYIMWLNLHTKYGDSIKLNYPLVAYRLSKNSISSNKLSMLKKRFLVYTLFKQQNHKVYLYMSGYIFLSTMKLFTNFFKKRHY